MQLSRAVILLFLFAQILYHNYGGEASHTDSDMDRTKYIMQTVVSQNRCLKFKKKEKKNDSQLRNLPEREKKRQHLSKSSKVV